MSNYYKGIVSGGGASGSNGQTWVQNTTTYRRVYFYDNNYTTAEAFTNFVLSRYNAGSPVKIYYPLATPTEETITLPNIPSIKGTTIYSVDTTTQSSSMYIKYKGK